jgi:phage gp46-like protein
VTDNEKIALGCQRWIELREKHGKTIHDLIAENMSQWLREHGYADTLQVMAHVAGNVALEEWNAVIEKALSDLKVTGPESRS